EASEYRQLCTETLLTLVAFVGENPQVQFDDDLALDVVIGHAVRVGWQLRHPEVARSDYGLHKAEAWDDFYRASPADGRRGQLRALQPRTAAPQEDNPGQPLIAA
ncbi:MAG: phosphorylase kinase, partial [Cyanobacteriota bacterium]